jgi:hypothetical protein
VDALVLGASTVVWTTHQTWSMRFNKSMFCLGGFQCSKCSCCHKHKQAWQVYTCGCGHVVAGVHYSNGVSQNNKKKKKRLPNGTDKHKNIMQPIRTHTKTCELSLHSCLLQSRHGSTDFDGWL